MALYGVSFVANLVAWDTVNNAPKTGDSANISLRWIKDGTSAATTNACSEVDATNDPGIYKVTLTATEAQAICGTLCGKSSSTGISIISITFTFEQLPNVAPGGSGGLVLADASGRVDIGKWLGTAVTLSSGVPDVNMKTITAGIIAAASFAANALDAVWSTTARTLTAFGFSVTASTVSDKTGYSLSGAGVQAIWDALTSALTTVGSIGKLLVTNIDALISSRTKPADTQAAVTLVATTTNLTNAPTAGDLTAAMKTSVTTAATAATPVAASVSGSVGSVASFGTLVADIWAYATRTLSAFAFTPSSTLSAAERNAIADALLARHQQGGAAGTSGTKVSDALAGGLMSLTISGGTLTVKNADGTTAYTRTLTRSALDAIIGAA